MTRDEFTDFKEDVREGDIVTLLLEGQRQETGRVLQMRASSVKLKPEGAEVSVVFSCAHIQSYAIGKYDFLRSQNVALSTEDKRQEAGAPEETAQEKPAQPKAEPKKEESLPPLTLPKGIKLGIRADAPLNEPEKKPLVIKRGATHTGYVDSFSALTKGGKIRDEESDQLYYFVLRHIHDDRVCANIANGIFTDKLQFGTFINTIGAEQAKNIEPVPALVVRRRGDRKYENENAVERKAKELISSGDREGGIEVYKEGLKQKGMEKSPLLLVGLAQQLAVTGQYADAARTYRQLINIETRPAARNYEMGQYAGVLAKARSLELARNELAALSDKDAAFMELKNLLENIADRLREDSSLADWGADLQEISQFLRRELESAEFMDQKIVRQGGRPLPEDAERLKKEALDPQKGAEEKFFSSLQSAKAYSLLDPGDYNPEDYYEALSNYAMQRGEVLVNRMLGLTTSPELADKSSVQLLRLRDSATSYFIESLSWMNSESVNKFAGSIIHNYLLAEMANHYASSLDGHEANLLKEKTFKSLFNKLLDPGAPSFPIVCWAFITWGSYREVWKRLNQIPDGPGAFTAKMEHVPFRATVKNELQARFGKLLKGKYPADILKEAFGLLLTEREKLRESFNHLLSISSMASPNYFQNMRVALNEFPMDNRALLQSDVKMLSRIKKVVEDMASYAVASDAERGDMLARARQDLEGGSASPLREIAEAPTYWKRVGCEPLIKQLLNRISAMESARMQARLPSITLTLEPPLFRREGYKLVSSLRIYNEGIASATKVMVYTTLRDEHGHVARLSELSVGVVPANVKRQNVSGHAIDMPFSIPAKLAEIEPIGARLELQARYNEGESPLFQYTVEEDRGIEQKNWDIPWDPSSLTKAGSFKGREDILSGLENCLAEEVSRSFTNMLYGVTRSGKSSILKFFRQRIQRQPVPNDKAGRRFFCIDWHFETCANTSCDNEVFRALLCNEPLRTIRKDFKNDARSLNLEQIWKKFLPDPFQARLEHFLPLVEELNAQKFYPVFLVDEFSYFRELHKRGAMGPAFLAVMRELALKRKAAFIVAGTWDILELLSDPRYGITGQFVNWRQVKVTKIDEESALELVDIGKEHLRFTGEARKYIINITGSRPYLIQYVCMNCARYARRENRSLLGLPEVHRVAEIMAGLEAGVQGISSFSANSFEKNLIFSDDSLAMIHAGITTMLALNENPSRLMTYNEMARLWRSRGLDKAVLAKGVESMLEREIIEAIEDEQALAYRLTVPIFGWWWKKMHPSLELELDKIAQD